MNFEHLLRTYQHIFSLSSYVHSSSSRSSVILDAVCCLIRRFCCAISARKILCSFSVSGSLPFAMPRYYCDYCDTYLTHDSPSVRKQHNAGYKHKANVRSYYQQFEEQQTQSLIDQRIKEHLGQTAAFQQQVGATFNQHLASLQSNPQRPRLPVLAPPILPIGSTQPSVNSPLMPGFRPPVLPRPAPSPPGYGVVTTMPMMSGPPGATPLLVQANGLPRPPVPSSTMGAAVSTSSGIPGMYQGSTGPAATGSFPGSTSSATQDSFSYGQTSEAG